MQATALYFSYPRVLVTWLQNHFSRTLTPLLPSMISLKQYQLFFLSVTHYMDKINTTSLKTTSVNGVRCSVSVTKLKFAVTRWLSAVLLCLFVVWGFFLPYHLIWHYNYSCTWIQRKQTKIQYHKTQRFHYHIFGMPASFGNMQDITALQEWT